MIADTTGGPNGIILYSLIAILYIFLIYDKKKRTPRPPKKTEQHMEPEYISNLGNYLPGHEYELSDMNTKTLEHNDDIFWPMTQGPNPIRNEIYNPGENDPTLV